MFDLFKQIQITKQKFFKNQPKITNIVLNNIKIKLNLSNKQI